MEPPLTFEEALGSDEPTVASFPPFVPIPAPLPLETPDDELSDLFVVEPGSFTLSTMAVTSALCLLAFTFVAFLAAGLLMGVGIGLALVALLLGA
ncbi:MAG: hypothetical protein KTR31_20395 [Myxococcales bacterium]|nr:hypothetical protein [Myxococcales bacterium]